MMPSLSGLGWTVYCLLLLWRQMSGKNIIGAFALLSSQSNMMVWLCLKTLEVTNVILSLLKQLQVKGLHFQVSERNRKLLHSFFWEFLQSPRAGISAQSAHRSQTSDAGPTQQHGEEAGERNPLLLKFIFMRLLFLHSSKQRDAMLSGSSSRGAAPRSGSAGEFRGWSGLRRQRTWEQGNSRHRSGEGDKQPWEQGDELSVSKEVKPETFKKRGEQCL